MKPFDLPPDNFLDLMRDDRCRPAEMRERELYLSKPTDEHPHRPHPHYDEPQSVGPPPPPQPDFPRRPLMSDDVPLRWQERDREAFFAAIGESLRRSGGDR